MKIGFFQAGFLATFLLSFLCEKSEAAFSSPYTLDGTVSSVSGSPIGVAYHSPSDKFLLAGFDSSEIRVIQGGVSSFITKSTTVPFNRPYGIWMDPDGNTFVANHYANNVLKVPPNGGTGISVIAGTGTGTSTGDGGPATSATLNRVAWVYGDTIGNIYVVEQYGWRVRKINKSDNKISTAVGSGVQGSGGDGGPATSALISETVGLFVDSTGDIFVAGTWGDRRIRWVSAASGIIKTIAGAGGTVSTTDGVQASISVLSGPSGIWGDWKGNIFVAERDAGKISVVARENNYEKLYLVASNIGGAFGVFGDDLSGRMWVTQYTSQSVTLLRTTPSPPLATTSVKPSSAPSTVASTTPSEGPTRAPTVSPSSLPSVQPSVAPTRVPTASPSSVPSITPSSSPSVTPSSAPSEAPTLAVPEYSLTVSAKSFKYFEIRVFTEANERVFPVSYDLVDCPENAGAVVWGHESTPTTEYTNTCVYGLPRHYWCECPALVNGNQPKLTLNFGGTVFDRVELLILDWVDGEVTVSDSANNIVLFSASRAGGPLVGEEFVRYDHLNLLQIAPSVTPTIVPSSTPTTKPSHVPTIKPTAASVVPTQTPTMVPTTTAPSAVPSVVPSMVPSAAPSFTAQYTITLTAKTFKYFEVRVYTHDNLRIFPVSYELEHCPENAGVAVWNDQITEDTNTCVYGYPRNFWCQCSAVADEKPKLVLHMGHTVFDRVELLLLNWEDGEVTVTDEANHETFLSATHDGVGNEFVTFDNLNLEHAAASPVRRLLRGA